MENPSIGCSVSECKYHAKAKNLCELTHIEIKKHGSGEASVECTDCASFIKG